MAYETETARINRLILQGGFNGMTELQFYAAELKEWKDSKRRKNQITGEAYYDGLQDILQRQRTTIGQDGKLQVVYNLPNNRLVDNQFALMVDQKTNYLVGKPFSLNCENKAYLEALKPVFNGKFRRLLKYICEDSLKGGIGWLYPFYNDQGQLAFKHFPAHELLPFWADDDHTILDCAIRLYPQEVWNGYQKEIVERVEIFKLDGLWRYVFKNDMLTPDVEMGEHENYFSISEGEEETPMNWERIPLIPFKYNKREIPLLNRVKCLQDAINTMISDFENNMQEDARNTILVIQNYDGENLGDFRHNLAAFGAVKVRENGGVTTLTVNVNVENYKGILELLKKALINNARGYDAKDAFEELLWFINMDLANKGKGDFEGEDITVVFNRDILINESEAITNCQNSVGILSTETIVEQHPWTKDAQTELERLKKEKEEAMADYMGAFPPKENAGSGDSNGDQGGD